MHILKIILLTGVTALLSGCAVSVSCDKIQNPPFGDRLTLAKELPTDGPTSQKWIVRYSAVLEACGYE